MVQRLLAYLPLLYESVLLAEPWLRALYFSVSPAHSARGMPMDEHLHPRPLLIGTEQGEAKEMLVDTETVDEICVQGLLGLVLEMTSLKYCCNNSFV